jgi:hypothetical protein
MGLPEASLFVTILIFVGGLIFQAGKQSNKIDNLEEWRRETRSDVQTILGALARLEGAIKEATR